MKRLFSPTLMFPSLLSLTIGCGLRVVTEALAYEGIARFAWRVLPRSAFVELAAVTLFASNLFLTFFFAPPVHLMSSSGSNNAA